MASSALPPGQHAREAFPRFGAPPFDTRFPRQLDRVEIQVSGDGATLVTLSDKLADLERVEQVSDFHCVTTWTCRALRWSGVRFADVYHHLVMPLAAPDPEATFVVFRAQDGYRSSLPLEDLLADDVLLADHLDGQPLTVAHGAPIRLVAPAHYGYKNIKHVNRIEFRRSDAGYRPTGYRFMAHPRARVAYEERGSGVPGRVLRALYRPLIGRTARRFELAMQQHEADSEASSAR